MAHGRGVWLQLELLQAHQVTPDERHKRTWRDHANAPLFDREVARVERHQVPATASNRGCQNGAVLAVRHQRRGLSSLPKVGVGYYPCGQRDEGLQDRQQAREPAPEG